MPDSSSAAGSRLIEVGWVLAGPLDAVDVESIEQARRQVRTWLEEQFPTFTWRMPVVRRMEAGTETRADPVSLLDVGVAERDDKRWDFALVITAADLKSYYKPFTLGTPAQALSVAVCSVARIDPAATLSTADSEQRAEKIGHRLFALALHQLGHLNDLDHSSDPSDLMFDLKTVEDLDAMTTLSESAAHRLREELTEVADLRLEEQLQNVRQRGFFYVRAAWLNRDDIWGALRHIQPWRFPFRFSRLTAAAFSTLLILMTTAEVWDLAISESSTFVTLLSLLVVAGTSYFLLRQQQLLVRRRKDRLSEQRVVARFSITLAVIIGMATTYVLLFGLSLALAHTFFSLDLVADWVTTVEGPLRFPHYLRLAGFVAAFGLVIGALGATFEKQPYFRHVAFVNEET